MDASSEAGFYIIFEWPLKPKHTIESIIRRTNPITPIEFYFGSVDWMDSVGAQKLHEDYKNISFSRISNAGHQLIFDNPDEVSWNIIQNAMKDEERQRRMADLAI